MPAALALTGAERLAIGAVQPELASIPALCTGVMIAPNWVLTAKHCDVARPLVFRVTADSSAPSVEFVAQEVLAHPDLDLLLLRVSATSGVGAGASSLVPIDEALDQRWLGSIAQLAGIGLDETNMVGQLLFLAEPIIDIDATAITLDGVGRSGACFGDSGGPLLLRGRDGTPRVAGILSKGSDDCLGLDKYVRLDVASARDWIIAHAGAQQPAKVAGCRDLDGAGMCRAGSPLWCAEQKVVFAECSPDERCGWDVAHKGYRCVHPSDDPCAGIDQTGACAASIVSRCLAGRFVREDCSSCGGQCGRETTRGDATCVLP